MSRGVVAPLKAEEWRPVAPLGSEDANDFGGATG